MIKTTTKVFNLNYASLQPVLEDSSFLERGEHNGSGVDRNSQVTPSSVGFSF